MKGLSNGFLVGYIILWVAMIDSVDCTRDLRRQLPSMVSDPNECTFQKTLPTAVNSFNSDCANLSSNFSTSTIRVTHYIFKLSGTDLRHNGYRLASG